MLDFSRVKNNFSIRSDIFSLRYKKIVGYFLSDVFFLNVLTFWFSDNAAYYDDREECAGAFYGGNGNAVAANVVFILAIIAWVGVTCTILFATIKFTIGIRVPKEMEVRLLEILLFSVRVRLEAIKRDISVYLSF